MENGWYKVDECFLRSGISAVFMDSANF